MERKGKEKTNKINKFKNFIVGLFHGMSAVDKEVFTQAGASTGTEIQTNDVISANPLAEALLRGEVTQEVKELRYRTYEVERKSDDYIYLANGVAVKKDDSFKQNRIPIDNTYDYPLQLIQENKLLVKNVAEELNRVGTYGGERKYLINIERTQIPRYRLEEFVKKIVVKRKDAEHVLLEFYCSKYADKFNLIMTQGFISEITKIKDEKKPTEIFTFDKVWFVTSHAYGSSDYLKYEYDNLHYIGITEFDGDYVIAFEANVVSDGFDLTSKFYDDIMAKKYENQEAKQKTTLDLTPQKEYTCKQCGKSINPYDARIIEQTYGEMICLDCLEKKAEELQNLKYSVKKP